ncbi:MAG TPA: peptidase M22 [Opitutaceae bacterium]|nr:peptidase M22 [Opitutaceae bacterium]
MPSLSQILKEHSPLLLIDAASAGIQVGLLGEGAPPRWSSRQDEAGVGVFECLDELDVGIDSVRSFAFCEGPGSILGIRISAMAIRMWNVLGLRPTFGFIGLAVVATALGRQDAAVIADARRGQWHRLVLGGALERVPASELSGELVMPEGFRHWDPLPAHTTRTPYDLAALFAMRHVADADLFRPAESPDAFLHQEPSYAKWVPQIHRAP